MENKDILNLHMKNLFQRTDFKSNKGRQAAEEYKLDNYSCIQIIQILYAKIKGKLKKNHYYLHMDKYLMN